MNFKVKLYILKNHTFLLLGPSSFEHWFKSYLCITVGSLYFLQIAFGSSFVYLSSPLLCFSAARCRSSGRSCAVLLPAPMPLCAHPRVAPASGPPLPGLALAPPHLATSSAVCLSRASPPLAVAATPAPPPASGDPTRHFPALPPPSRPYAGSHPRSPRHIAAVRVPPCCHARCQRDSSCFRATTSPLRPRTHPDAPYALVLAFAHMHSTQFLCSDHLPPPDLRRRPWPSSTAAHITPEPRSSAARAPP
jgi:hypothetical protein